MSAANFEDMDGTVKLTTPSSILPKVRVAAADSSLVLERGSTRGDLFAVEGAHPQAKVSANFLGRGRNSIRVSRSRVSQGQMMRSRSTWNPRGSTLTMLAHPTDWEPELFGKPEPDHDDPEIKGATCFADAKSDYMDEQFYNCMVLGEEDEKYGEILLNADKLTRGSFNILMPLRDHYLESQFEEIGIENIPKYRTAFYELIYSTPNLGNYTSGAVLTEELIRRPDKKFQRILKDNYLLIGRSIGAETSAARFAATAKEYYDLGCRFAVIRQDFSVISVIEAAR